MNQELFTQALHIEEPWFIEDIQFNNEKRRLDIDINFRAGSRFQYTDPKTEESGEYPVHDTTRKSWQHLNFFEHTCYINARVPRIKTESGKVRLIRTPWEGLNSGFTQLFEALLLQLASSMTVNELSRLTGISNYRLWNLIRMYVDSTLDTADYASVEAVGVDETSAKKGHNYLTLFVDLKTRKVIFITKGKSHETIGRFCCDLVDHKGKPSKIKHVCCDMSPAFIKGIVENFESASVTFDKFHVIKLINDAVDQVRREEAKSETVLKKKRYALLKNQCNLTLREKRQIEELELTKINLKTMRAYRIRNSFQMIYEAKTVEDFSLLLKKWYFWATHSRLKPIIKVAKTIKKHWDGIVNWVDSKINNGILEGLNSIVQTAKNQSRGFKTFEYFRLIIFLKLGKLDFSSLNQYYQSTRF
jgi:transposase